MNVFNLEMTTLSFSSYCRRHFPRTHFDVLPKAHICVAGFRCGLILANPGSSVSLWKKQKMKLRLNSIRQCHSSLQTCWKKQKYYSIFCVCVCSGCERERNRQTMGWGGCNFRASQNGTGSTSKYVQRGGTVLCIVASQEEGCEFEYASSFFFLCPCRFPRSAWEALTALTTEVVLCALWGESVAVNGCLSVCGPPRWWQPVQGVTHLLLKGSWERPPPPPHWKLERRFVAWCFLVPLNSVRSPSELAKASPCGRLGEPHSPLPGSPELRSICPLQVSRWEH